MKLEENSKKQKSFVSSDAPPLDFSFRNIKKLEDILVMHPQSGARKPVVIIQHEDNKHIRT